LYLLHSADAAHRFAGLTIDLRWIDLQASPVGPALIFA